MKQTKTCAKCAEEKLLTEFHVHKTSKDGRRSNCIECKTQWNDQRNERFKEAYPAPDKGVYGIKDPKGELIYIGESDELSNRIYRHFNQRSNKSTVCYKLNGDMENITYDILWYGDDDSDRKYQEKVLVDLHRPKFNKRLK